MDYFNKCNFRKHQ